VHVVDVVFGVCVCVCVCGGGGVVGVGVGVGVGGGGGLCDPVKHCANECLQTICNVSFLNSHVSFHLCLYRRKSVLFHSSLPSAEGVLHTCLDPKHVLTSGSVKTLGPNVFCLDPLMLLAPQKK
jgi:hypothetical protein